MKKTISILLSLCIFSSNSCFAATEANKTEKKSKSTIVNFIKSHPILTISGLAATVSTFYLAHKGIKTFNNKTDKEDSIKIQENDIVFENSMELEKDCKVKITILDNGDITTAPKLFSNNKVAIVNAANSLLVNGTGVCGSIFNATSNKGSDLKKAIDKIPTIGNSVAKCLPGEAVSTDPCGIENTHILIHTVAPNMGNDNWPENKFDKWNNETQNLLKNCYKASLELANKSGCDTIIFPSLGTGIYKCPIKKYENDNFVGTPRYIKEAIQEYYNENPNSNINNIVFALRGNCAINLYKEKLFS